jgi:hypothetical protein
LGGNQPKERIQHRVGNQPKEIIQHWAGNQPKERIQHWAGNQPKERIQHSQYGESLQSRMFEHQYVHYTTQHDILLALHLDESSV